MLDGWCKADPPPTKKLPVEADILEYLCLIGHTMTATPLKAAVRDLALITFYYLLWVGEYMTKGLHNAKTNHPVQS